MLSSLLLPSSEAGLSLRIHPCSQKSFGRCFMRRPECNYCHAEGVMKTFRHVLPIPVPPGAKDLKLTHTVEGILWQCSRCDNILGGGARRCKCGTEALEPEYAGELPDAPALLQMNNDFEWYSCTNCAPCAICEKPLQTRHYTKLDRIGGFYSKPDHYYMHPNCAKLGTEKIKKMETTNLENSERNVREKKCVCVVCGKPFTIFNRRAEYCCVHNNCKNKAFSW